MELKISNKARVNNRERTAMSQQSLVNTLLAEKQAVQHKPKKKKKKKPVTERGR